MTKQHSTQMSLRQINEQRVKAGVCRHCGGPVPCYSEFGDQKVGVRHTAASLRRLRK